MGHLSQILLCLAVLLFTPLSLKASGHEISVMTYNVWGRPWPLPRKPSRFKKLPEMIAKTNADIVGMQEVFTRKARVFQNMGEYLYYSKFNDRGIFKQGAGLLTLSKFPILKSKTLTFSECSGTDCFAKKGVLMTRLSIGPGLKLDVYNAHLNAAGEDEVREHQLRETADFILKNSPIDSNVILLGDMNIDAKNSLYLLFSDLIDIKDSYKDYVDTLASPTRIQRDGYTNQPKKGKKGQRIDYVFYRSEILKVIKSEVNMNGANTRLSDHDGVLTKFNISQN